MKPDIKERADFYTGNILDFYANNKNKISKTVRIRIDVKIIWGTF